MAFAQIIKATTAGGTSLTTAPTDFTGANFLIGIHAYPASAGPATGWSDSKSNAGWTAHPNGVHTFTGTNAQARVYYCPSPTVDAAQTFTASITTSDIMFIAVIGLSGRSTAVEGANYAGDASAVTSHSGGVTGALTAGDDVVALFSDDEGTFSGRALTYGAGSGWTLPAGGVNQDGRTLMTGGILYQTNVGTGSVTASWTTTGANTGGAFVLAIKAASANATVTPGAGSNTVTGNQPTVTPATNTVVQTFTARHGSGVLEPDRRVIMPREKRIFLPTRKAA